MTQATQLSPGEPRSLVESGAPGWSWRLRCPDSRLFTDPLSQSPLAYAHPSSTESSDDDDVSVFVFVLERLLCLAVDS